MPEVSREVLERVKEAFDRYEAEVETSDLRPSAKQTYLLHSRNFVRWLDDDFEPGGTLKRRHRFPN